MKILSFSFPCAMKFSANVEILKFLLIYDFSVYDI